jgi:uncharacterized protein
MIIDIAVIPGEESDPEKIKQKIIASGISDAATLKGFRVVKRSLDARGKNIVYRLKVEIFRENPLPAESFDAPPLRDISKETPVFIAGAGPAGLFAALELIEQNKKPVILERGKEVRDRRRDLVNLIRRHEVNPDSNYCFGEGGAGTYSDGKLYTRSDKRGDVKKVLKTLVMFGAPERILIDAHPHIGTDKLPKIIENIRNYILSCGGEIHFNTRISDFRMEQGKIKTLICRDEKEFQCTRLILATGHSARDIFELLHKHNIQIEEKPFALGLRIEHPQQTIDRAQYRCAVRPENLPPASYALVTQQSGRGVFSFCMCPGGIIAPCATEAGEIVTNGWSPSGRNNYHANSGLVVTVNEQDWQNMQAGAGLRAMKFQSLWERKASELSGGTQKAPAQRAVDFVQGKTSSSLPSCSYLPGVFSADLKEILPEIVHKALREALKDFGKKIKGYLSEEALLTGPESRTSSPVKIPRDKEKLNHPEVSNMYPCGEGAGYAGGIVSAALDGIRCATAAAH